MYIYIYIYIYILYEYSYTYKINANIDNEGTNDSERGRNYCLNMVYSDLELRIENFMVCSRRTFSVMHNATKGIYTVIYLFVCICIDKTLM
jgi:hypothetical protein